MGFAAKIYKLDIVSDQRFPDSNVLEMPLKYKNLK